MQTGRTEERDGQLKVGKHIKIRTKKMLSLKLGMVISFSKSNCFTCVYFNEISTNIICLVR